MNISLIRNEISNNNRNIKLPKLNGDKKLRIILLIATTIFLLVNCFYGQAIAKYNPLCIDDMSQIYSKYQYFFFKSSKI